MEACRHVFAEGHELTLVEPVGDLPLVQNEGGVEEARTVLAEAVEEHPCLGLLLKEHEPACRLPAETAHGHVHDALGRQQQSGPVGCGPRLEGGGKERLDALCGIGARIGVDHGQRIEALFPAAFKPWPASDRPRLLLTPEGIVERPVSRLGREAAGRLVLLQEKTEARVLFNGFRKDGPRFFNTSFVLDEGQIAYRLDKRELVPFGEYVPAGFHWFVEMIGIPMSDLMRGDAVQPLLSLGGADAGILICYENLYGSVVRTFWQSRSPDFLIVTVQPRLVRTLRARTAPHDEPHARDRKRKAAGEREQHGHERPRQFEGRDGGHAQDRWSRCRDHAASGRHGLAHALCEARQLARAARIARSGALRRARPLRDSQNPSGQGKGLIIKSLSSRFRQEREGSLIF